MTVTSIRWEARSHAEIYSEAHTSAYGADHGLAVTVPWWRQGAADLGEVRSRYESAVNRLLSTAEGVAADAAAVATRLVTRGLTEAQELTYLAGTRRAVLNDLNGELRASLPVPVTPVEHSGVFLHEGLHWLFAPDFVAEDDRRINEEAIARDRMRAYDQAIGTEALGYGHRQDRVGAALGHDLPPGETTLPLRVRSPGGPPQADFGPTGHGEPVQDVDEEATVLGTPPPLREWLDAPSVVARRPRGPFEPDVGVAPPVIGE